MSSSEKKNYYIGLIDLIVGVSEAERERYKKLSVEELEEKYKLIFLEVSDELINC